MINNTNDEFLMNLKEKYNAKIEMKDDGLLHIDIFDGEYICKEIYNFKNIIANYEKVILTAQKISRNYIKNIFKK